MAWATPRILKSGKKRWYVYERINGKRPCFGAYPSEALANIRIAEVELAVARDSLGMTTIKDSKKTLGAWIEKFKEVKKDEKISKNYIRIIHYSLKKLLDYFGPDMQVGLITAIKLKDLREDMLSKQDKNGVLINLRYIKMFFKYLHKRNCFKENIAKDISEGLKPRDVSRYLNKDEVAKIMGACRFSPRGELWKIVKLTLYTSMRREEALTVRKEWYNPSQQSITMDGKTDERTIRLHKDLSYIFEEATPGLVFKKWSFDRLENAYRRAIKRSGVGGRVRFHDLRHSFCKWFLDIPGNSLKDLQGFTGHTNLVSLGRYTRFQVTFSAERLNSMDLGIEKCDYNVTGFGKNGQDLARTDKIEFSPEPQVIDVEKVA